MMSTGFTKIDKATQDHYFELSRQLAAVRDAVATETVCSKSLIENLLICIIAKEHGFLIGNVGLGQTQIISMLTRFLGLSFKRLVMSEDSFSSDIEGHLIEYEDKSTGELRVQIGNFPLQANIVLVDELERAPKSTQNKLIEIMRARSVTLAGRDHALPHPFVVFATRIETPEHGILSRSQFDSFMICESLAYPNEEDEFQRWRYLTNEKEGFEPILKASDVATAQKIIPSMPITDFCVRFATAIVRATRPESPDAPPIVKEFLSAGAGTRSIGHLITAAKTRAFLNGRHHTQLSDIESLTLPILQQRVETSFNAEAEGISAEDVLYNILKELPKGEFENDKDEPLND